MNDYMNNKITWQAYMSMWVELECLKDGHFPNGQKLKKEDVTECNRRIDAAKEVLLFHNVAFPVVEDKAGDQLGLF